jgi:1-acyl-sn-glycerol-3-phosphate acyltransferase
MIKLLRFLFFKVFIRSIFKFYMGLSVKGFENLPVVGPAVVIANHNSHLDTAALIALFGRKTLPLVRAAAAADYFLKNPVIAWFSMNIIGIIPVDRKGKDTTVDEKLAGIYRALSQGEIVIFFPEGSRGEPEELSEFKSGIALVAEKFPKVPITPVFMSGLGKALPKGEALLVPFNCEVIVGKPVFWRGDRTVFIEELRGYIAALAKDHARPFES